VRLDLTEFEASVLLRIVGGINGCGKGRAVTNAIYNGLRKLDVEPPADIRFDGDLKYNEDPR
jgi:hypothetical protein